MTKLKIKWKPDFSSSSGTMSTVSWERMYKHIASEINLKDEERINGIIVDENGIQCNIGRK